MLQRAEAAAAAESASHNMVKPGCVLQFSTKTLAFIRD